MLTESGFRKSRAVNKAEEKGLIADSLDVRKELLSRAKAGEITLEEAKKELAKIKRNAKKQGKQTRAEVWRKG